VLEHIKENQGASYADDVVFKSKFVGELNKIHCNATKASKDTEFYIIKDTAKYIQLKCGVSSKCKFMVWYEFNKKDDNGRFFSIKYCRGINLNHEVALHKLENKI
jgi:hypothetical protein